MELEVFVFLIVHVMKAYFSKQTWENVCLGRHEWKAGRNRQRIALIPTKLNFNTEELED